MVTPTETASIGLRSRFAHSQNSDQGSVSSERFVDGGVSSQTQSNMQSKGQSQRNEAISL